MDEYFLQFLWKFQKFNNSPLQLTDGTTLTVLKTGFQNFDSGPDFKEAKLKIGDLIWSGSVEIHYRSSDWNRHNHQQDESYKNVILHVVWTHDSAIQINGNIVPTLTLSNHVSSDLEAEYRRYINQPETIRCSSQLSFVPSIQVSTMLDRALTSRLESKSSQIFYDLENCKGDWEQTTYLTLGRNFGFKTNASAFERLCHSLPYAILRKHFEQPEQVYSLIFGMAGFLNKAIDPYTEKLKSEFDYLSRKYNLEPALDQHNWLFAKMRPANFPSVRLAQFASIVCYNKQLFANLLASDSLNDLRTLIQKPLPDYWQTHYNLGKPSTRKQKIGDSTLENIIINSLVPILAAYAKYLDNGEYMDKAQAHLEVLHGEKNHITKAWELAGITSNSAADSQALIFQYREMCIKKRCLNCNIGTWILNKP